LKNNYPLPKMDHILQRFVGVKRISMLDGYSGYNQISVVEEDKKKTILPLPGVLLCTKICPLDR
jgi:hypothetical protein